MISAAILLPVPLLLWAAEWPYQQAVPGYQYSFPRDHFAHPEFRTEWWYYTGNLRDDDGRRFGFESVFFRQAQRRGKPENPSAWRVDDLYLAHLALTDVKRGAFLYHKRLNRAGPGIAGASQDNGRVWNGNWSAEIQGDRQRLSAKAPEFQYVLNLRSMKPPVVHGKDGVSQKAVGRGKASHYVSLTRLAVTGELTVGGKTTRVTGSAWMDHEWFTHQLELEQVGWDWFSMQLDDGSELMLFRLRRKDGSVDPHSSGTYVDAHGNRRHVEHREFSLEPLEHWQSPKTKGKYPVRWRIRVPSIGIDLICRAALLDQEIPQEGAGPGYWEGAVTYSGSQNGVGYLEMTGYDRPVRLE